MLLPRLGTGGLWPRQCPLRRERQPREQRPHVGGRGHEQQGKRRTGRVSLHFMGQLPGSQRCPFRGRLRAWGAALVHRGRGDRGADTQQAGATPSGGPTPPVLTWKSHPPALRPGRVRAGPLCPPEAGTRQILDTSAVGDVQDQLQMTARLLSR